MRNLKGLKRFFVLLLVVIMACPFLFACNGEAENNAEYITIRFDSCGGNVIDAMEVLSGSVVPKPMNPEKKGYVFSNWYKERAYVNVWNFSEDMVNSDITLYALWHRGEEFTVTFDSKGGTEVTEQKVEYCGKVIEPEPPTKTNYIFLGWYLQNGEEWIFDIDTVFMDVTLYARWGHESTLTANVSYIDGNTEIARKKVILGKTVENISLEKSNHLFVGWYLNGAPYNFSLPVTQSIKLYARWVWSYKEVSRCDAGNSFYLCYWDKGYNPQIKEPDDTHYDSCSGWDLGKLRIKRDRVKEENKYQISFVMNYNYDDLPHGKQNGIWHQKLVKDSYNGRVYDTDIRGAIGFGAYELTITYANGEREKKTRCNFLQDGLHANDETLIFMKQTSQEIKKITLIMVYELKKNIFINYYINCRVVYDIDLT